MTSSTTTSVQISATQAEQKEADLVRLDDLCRGARAEFETYLALMRKSAAIVFRCGEKLAEAQVILKRLKIYWIDKVKEYGIAESTANQAVKLYQNATAAGYTAEDLEQFPITEAKVFFDVIKSPAKIEEERKLKEEEARSEGESNRKSQKQAGGKGGGKGPKAFVTPAAKPEPEGEDGSAEGDQDFDEIEISDLLIFRQHQLDEVALVRWNEGRERPFDQDYLLVLIDLGVLTVENNKARYLPDREDDLEEMVGVLADKLAPVLERWATPDDVLSALKGLISLEAVEVEASKAEATEVEPQKKRRVHVRRTGSQPRA